jgi:flagellar basal-body rod protein FlgG
MMRSLWTAASGMTAQQFNVDVISNNLANVNTTAYKTERAEFKDLFYETLDHAYAVGGKGKPVNLQVGHGTTVVSTVRNFGDGNTEKTENPLDLAITGEAFFMVRSPRGDTAYTRDGSFKLSVTADGSKLTTSDGYPVLDDSGNDIILNADISNLTISPEGDLIITDSTGTATPLGQKIGLVKFANKAGLEGIGSDMYSQNSASGQAVPDSDLGTKSTILQGFLESSNVKVVEEMVKLIIAQRAYEVNSKAIQSSDEMLAMANGLKR